MPRRDIRMSEAEVTAFLSEHSGCVIGYNDAGPAPVARTGTYTLAGGTLRVTMPAPAPGKAAAALREDPRVCVIVEQSPSYYEIAYVAAEGQATQVEESSSGLNFELTARDVTSASFAKLADPPG